MTLRPITDWCSHKALFYDDLGHFVGSKTLKYNEPYFEYGGGVYNFLPEKSTFFKLRTLFKTTKYYQYNIHDPMPLLLDKKLSPVIHPTTYKTILDSDLVKKLNPKKLNLWDLIGGWKGLIIIIIILGLLYYFTNGGSLTSVTTNSTNVRP